MKRLIDIVCTKCGHAQIDVMLEYPWYPLCDVCGGITERLWSKVAAVRQDSIEGGVLIHHGICNEDGSPKRYYSRSEIKLACEVKGFVPYHDVYQEGGNRRLEDARHREDYLQSGEAKRAKKWRDEARAEKRLAESRR